MLVRPDYLALDAQNRLEEIFCKVCGSSIAKVEDTVLKRSVNYAEASLDTDDGGRHITCLCTQCLLDVCDNRGALQEIFEADISVLANEIPSISSQSVRRVLRLRTADLRQRGIV